MAMEELDEFEVLWRDTCCHTREPPPSSLVARAGAAVRGARRGALSPRGRSQPQGCPGVPVGRAEGR